MPGFYISNDKVMLPDCIKQKTTEDFLIDVMENDKFWWARKTTDKFINDKLFYEDNNYIIITDGVIVNLKNLLIMYSAETLVDLIYKLLTLRKDFFSEFRGTFSGAVFIKEKDEWIVYTGPHGEHNIFYYEQGNKFYIGSEVTFLLDVINKRKYSLTLNERAVKFMLTYGYMADDSTYATEIKTLLPGHFLKIEREGRIVIEKYYELEKNTIDLSDRNEQEIIDELDDRFRKAVKLQFDKDIEYGYYHLADLSGGLDSRMVNWVAREMGYKDILNINYCCSNHLDEIISKQVAKKLGNDIILLPLDAGNFMFDIDETVRELGGLALYLGNTGCMRLLSNLNMKKYGIKHGGNLGDVVVGSFLQSERDEMNIKPEGMYSTKLTDQGADDISIRYKDQELYLMNVRGFMANCSCSVGILRNWTEMVSPFQNIEFLEYCMSIPVRLRAHHYIYSRWIQEKYPEASMFLWAKTGVNIRKYSNAPILCVGQKIKKKGIKTIRKIKRFIQNLSSNRIMFDDKFDMNPMEYWYSKNSNVKNFMDSYFEKNINHRGLSENVKRQISSLYHEGSAIEKGQVMTVLSAIGLYFRNSEGE